MQNLLDIVDSVLVNAQRIRFVQAAQAKRDNGNWYPACGGTEVPFTTRGGHRLLYVWQPSTGKHAYLNLDTDIILSDDEARATLGTY